MANDIDKIPTIPSVKTKEKDLQVAMDRIKIANEMIRNELNRLQSEKQDS